MACRDTLVEMGQEVTPFVIARLSDGSWQYRWDLVNTLGYLGDINAVPALVDRVLKDSSEHVRWRSLWALSACDRRRGKTIDLFFANLDNSDPVQSWNAAIGLSFMDNNRGLAIVHEHLNDPDHFVRWEAVNALGRIADETSSKRLEERLLTDVDPLVRRETVTVLGRICDEESRRILKVALAIQDPHIRWRAAFGLGGCKNPDDLAPLLERQTHRKRPEHT